MIIPVVGDTVDVLAAICAIERRPAQDVVGGWLRAGPDRMGTAPAVARRVGRARRHRGRVSPLFAEE